MMNSLMRKAANDDNAWKALYHKPMANNPSHGNEPRQWLRCFERLMCGVRPFGVSLFIAGYDDKVPQLYSVDTSGSYFSWKASAMGKNVSNSKTFLEKRMAKSYEIEHPVKACGWAARDTSGVFSPFNFSRSSRFFTVAFAIRTFTWSRMSGE
ncbi:proteasome subunit alpha type-2-b [Phtheirospermum japonicum]|uniref:Proteasome subunit alpha type-2-b n=1 Tax=Phtheirospermum japonicum TaxID=374723 RepID=A0A830B2V9_9LAMI|nr:proteasome subunit alpha type-2-b [Phtheirospermum japonicum]